MASQRTQNSTHFGPGPARSCATGTLLPSQPRLTTVSPLLIVLWAYWSFILPKTPGPCLCYFLCLEHSPPPLPLAPHRASSSIPSGLKCHLLQEASSAFPTQSRPLLSSFSARLLVFCLSPPSECQLHEAGIIYAQSLVYYLIYREVVKHLLKVTA